MNFATALREIIQDQYLLLLFVTHLQDVVTIQVCTDDETPLLSTALMNGYFLILGPILAVQDSSKWMLKYNYK